MFQNILTLDPKDDDFVVLSGDEEEDEVDDDDEEEDEEDQKMNEMAEKLVKLSAEFNVMKAKVEKLEQVGMNKKRRCRKNVSS